jgi:ATP-dependent Clp protease, protease subunit
MLLAAGGQPIDVRISSPGGDGFAGTACYNLLAQYSGEVTCRIDSIAASSASLVCMAGKRIMAPENSYMHIHCPIGMVVGNGQAHRKMADDLDRMTGLDARVYAKRARQPVSFITELMGQDRLMTATEAHKLGFIDELIRSAEAVAHFDLSKLPKSCAGFARHVGQRRLRTEMGIAALH